jgi:hypothetical protein
MNQHLGPEAAAPFTPAEAMRMNGTNSPHDDGECLMPVPPDAGQPPARKVNGHLADSKYIYRSASKALLGYVFRYEARDGDRKQFRPITYWRDANGKCGWKVRAWPGARPLYGLDKLAAHPDAIVLLAEGEKTSEAVELGPLADAFKWDTPVVIGVTWPGGGKAIEHADFSPLAGRDVVILPDADEPGERTADALVEKLQKIGVRRLRRWKAPPETNDGWDIADEIPAGLTPEGIARSIFDAPEVASTVPIDLGGVFSFLGDAPAAAPRELIKKLLPAEGVAVTGGQSSAGKTFIQIHKAICLATTLPYFGHKIVERVGTVFVAAEGRALIPNRFAAALAKEQITQKLPIAWLKQLPDFGSASGIKLFISRLKAIEQRFLGDFGVRLGMVPIDTVAASFSMKDEDDNAEATKVCNIMRSIGDEIGALMAPVHHFGKNPESGLRGASAWKGSADLVEGVLADIDPLTGKASNRELVCTKARDGEQGPLSPFELEFVTLGTDSEGEIYGSCCVVPLNGQSRFAKAAALSKSQRSIQEAIAEALDTRGKIITPRAGMPAVKAAKVSDVRTEFDRRYVVTEDDPAKVANAKRMAFKRSLDRLPPSQFGAGSAEGADWIWRSA